jgi:thioredoxin 2
VELICPHCHARNRVPDTRLADQPVCGKCKLPLLPGEPIVLDDGTFDRFIANDGLPIVVDFWAPWCGPCKMFAPTFAQAASEWTGKLRFVKVDTEANAHLAQRFAIRSIPTLALFRNGREADRVSGALDPRGLRQWLQART